MRFLGDPAVTTIEEYVAAHPELGEPWTRILTSGPKADRLRQQGFADRYLIERQSPLTGKREVWPLALVNRDEEYSDNIPPPPVEAPPKLVHAVDISTSRLTAEACACLREQGYGRIIVGIRQDNFALTRHNLQVAHGEGFETEAYVYLWWGGDTYQRTAAGCELVAPFASFLHIDCEDNGNGAPGQPLGIASQNIVHKISRSVQACAQASMPHGIYSGAWWWIPATDNSEAFRDLPLWAADYDGIADLDVWRPFGGWERPSTKQYQGTTNLCGLAVDLNIGLG